MNRQQRRMQESARSKLLSHNPTFNSFCEINLNESPAVPPGCIKAFQNSVYIVTVYEEQTTKGPATKLMIQRKDGKVPSNQFADFQRIKNDILGKDAMVIQYYPPERDLVDKYNIYWLFAFNTEQVPVLI